MDLRAYYLKVRETEGTLPTPQVVLVSLATPDGGKPGVVTEVPTVIAARMIVEGSARIAGNTEIQIFRDNEVTVRQALDDAITASKVQVVVVPASAMTPKPPAPSGKER